ncbi:glycoside hydrolase family 2 TIM barrel-domain containing protein [Chondrinema litorale]|uniref:glycoside hydrolase family 2 TIM barrel-domain containing protein n=1 Tax=Chondrinema litorale TaxID=2994555 RepID=UPI00254345D3|nr:glycoside hydrolase family 2 TIM barrel-domain containing protein [Chondrinema litorale]UZR99162.1 hypothetical protein OQ292_34715 [Chondrinema litorale]
MKKTIVLSIMMLLSFFASAQKVSLNGTWDFQTDMYKQGEKTKWYLPETNIAGWDKMEVPGNWDLENEYADFVGVAWYRRTFKTESDWKGKRVRLYFQSVFNDSKVWLNGKLIAENHLGFLPFWTDIQDVINPTGENVLVVKTDNTFKRGAVWNWGGIRRPVWLEITPILRLEKQHITAIPDLQKGTASVSIDIKLSNASEQNAKANYKHSIIRDGKMIWTTTSKTPLEVKAGDENEAVVKLKLKKRDVALWHFNHPELYTCITEVLVDGKVIHQLSNRFGIRKVEVDGYDLKLNGEPVRTVGFNLVPEDRVTGNTLPLWRIKEDVDLMKSLGANMARLSHLPLPKEFLDYLDEKGIMVFEEVSLWGKDAMVDPDHPTPKEWLERMVEEKYNHPSIIGWSIGNEIGKLDVNPKVREYVSGAIAHAKSLDPERLAIYVSHSAHYQKNDAVEFSDLIMFNIYGGWGKNVASVNQLYPGKPIFMAEYGKILNNEDPNKAYVDAAEMVDGFRDKEYMAGASLWTFNDYRSFWKASPEWTTPPSQNRAWGVVNTFRQKKKPFYAFKTAYAPVRDFKVINLVAGKAEVTFQPRHKQDIPAYTLRDYRLVWAGFDASGKACTGSFQTLPEILPGTENRNFPITWEDGGISKLEVHLLDPQNYSVLDTTIYFQAPETPKILKVNTAAKSARVVFEKVENASAYKLKYGKKGASKTETAETINDFIEVVELEGFTEYEFEVIALNNAGESKASKVVLASTDEDELPPVIWNSFPADQSFFIGYTVNRQDYVYEIAFGTESENYTDTLVLRNVGVCKIPNLQNGQTYYYKMRVRKQWGFASEWSHEVSVMPHAGSAKNETEVLAVLNNGDEHMILFEPVQKSTGYELHLVNGNADKPMIISSSNSPFFYIKSDSINEQSKLTIKVN